MMESIKFSSPPRFDNFEEALRIDQYSPVASKWFLVIVDVRNSTQAIQEGRYKEVNSVAGAAVMSVLNAVGRVPFVFGGDGVTFLLSPDSVDKATHVLALTRKMAREAFRLELAVGKVPVRDLYQEGYTLGLADFSLSPAQSLSMFSGSAIAVAEAWVKSKDRGSKYAVADPKNPNPPADYTGLECRWNPLKARNGVSLTIIAYCPQPLQRAQQVYRSLASNIHTLVGGNANPVKKENLKLATRLSAFITESRIRRFGTRFLSRLVYQCIQFLTAAWAARFWLPSATGTRYIHEVIHHSDFRKFDGCLRMVLDVTPETVRRISDLLEKYYQSGDIAYGTHQSDHVLLTCMIADRKKGKHFHLVDGGNGGYTMASKELKRRMLTMKPEQKETA
ncbi:MAG: DUF3095 family protein [Bdellovibrionaceae bacterium]|nr:DUF3095 family protein [Pseudobdellovibrionaceae bacterium]